MALVYQPYDMKQQAQCPIPVKFTDSCNCIHYPDLAELRSGSLSGKEDLSSIPTEFVFATTGTYVSEGSVETLLKLGFKEVGAMKNWHWIHVNEWTKPIRLFWLRVHSKKDAKPYLKLNPQHFSASNENTRSYHKDQVQFLQRNGCGLKVSDKISRHSMYRYFGLLRMPVKPSKHQLRWLKAANYRLIDTGNLASFWCNGWESAADWSIKIEQEFWRKRGISWVEETDFTYKFREPPAGPNYSWQMKGKYTPGIRVALRKYIQAGGVGRTLYLKQIKANPPTKGHAKAV